MNRVRKTAISVLLALVLCISASGADALADTARRVREKTPAPIVNAVGGDWVVTGLARSGSEVPAGFYADYRARVEKTLREKNGELSARKYTEYSRVVLSLTAIGTDARSVSGYDLTRPLGDYGATVHQGLNGAIFALLALDAAGYPMPLNADAAIQATRQMYIGTILGAQSADGGWSLSGRGSEADVTAMALQALAKYRAQTHVSAAVDRGLACLSRMQDGDGGFRSDDYPTCESCAQVILALCELGLSTEDTRFVKNGKSVLDALQSYRLSTGGYRHIAVGAEDTMASEQALLALASLDRTENGRNTLYRMGDALRLQRASVTFPDIARHRNRAAIERLALRGVVNGKGNGNYDPEGKLTRAEFAAIVTRGVGLVPQTNAAFTDVSAKAWYAPYVGAACASKITKGTGAGTTFSPGANITRQEAAVMLARAAAYCGMTVTGAPAVSGAADWAKSEVAFCVQRGILSASDLRLTDFVTRGEMAAMVDRLIALASLA